MATRGRKPKSKNQTDDLLKALRFVALAQKDDGTVLQRHCVLNGGWLAATDNVRTMGVKVAGTLEACPQTKRLIAALERCEGAVTIAQEDADRLSVVSGRLRVKVPCVELDGMQMAWADPLAEPLTNEFVTALRSIAHIANDTGMTIQTASVLCTGPTVKATNSQILVEWFHGLNTPDYWVLPASSVDALCKIDKKLVGLGFSGRSATFYFDDESWLRTQLFEDKWPNTETLWALSSTTESKPILDKFFDSVSTLSAFSENGFVEFNENLLTVLGSQKADKAEIELEGLEKGPTVKIKNLMLVSKIAKTMQFTDRKMYMFGDKCRIVLSITTEI